MQKKAQLSSLSDETPEGRSIVVLAKNKFGIRLQDTSPQDLEFVPFTAQTRMSGVNVIKDGNKSFIRKGAQDSMQKHIEALGGNIQVM